MESVWIATPESKDTLGVSDRTLSVLNALLTCLPETAIHSQARLQSIKRAALVAKPWHG